MTASSLWQLWLYDSYSDQHVDAHVPTISRTGLKRSCCTDFDDEPQHATKKHRQSTSLSLDLPDCGTAPHVDDHVPRTSSMRLKRSSCSEFDDEPRHTTNEHRQSHIASTIDNQRQPSPQCIPLTRLPSRSILSMINQPKGNLAPINKDCPSTEIDSSSAPCTPTEIEGEDDCIDELLELAQKSPSTCDSQLTEDNVDKGPHQIGMPTCIDMQPPDVHWSLSQRFYDDVDSRLRQVDGQPWFDKHVMDAANLHDYEGCVSDASSYIMSNCDHWYRFKIGITENPEHRWNNSRYGYAHSPMWDVFCVLYAAPSSKWNVKKYESESMTSLKRSSTGAMERRLVKQFAGFPNCINRPDSGGDCPSDGSPHFCYVVYSHALD